MAFQKTFINLSGYTELFLCSSSQTLKPAGLLLRESLDVVPAAGWLFMVFADMPRVTLIATFGVGKEFSSRANWPEVLEVFRLPLGILQGPPISLD